MPKRRKATGRWSTRKSFAPARKSSARRAAPRQQTMKIVVEVAPQNPVSRPDVSRLSLVEKPKGKAKL